MYDIKANNNLFARIIQFPCKFNLLYLICSLIFLFAHDKSQKKMQKY